MRLINRTTASIAAITALGVTIGGVAYADAGSGSTQHGATTRQQLTTPRAHRHPLLRRTLHGRFVVRTKPGHTATVDIQRGAITAVSPTSLTLTSSDGVAETYVLTGKTKIRSHGRAFPAGQLAVGDRGLVVAIETDGSKVARAIRGVHVPKGSTSSSTG
jgi:hypothetical protein